MSMSTPSTPNLNKRLSPESFSQSALHTRAHFSARPDLDAVDSLVETRCESASPIMGVSRNRARHNGGSQMRRLEIVCVCGVSKLFRGETSTEVIAQIDASGWQEGHGKEADLGPGRIKGVCSECLELQDA